MTTAIKSCRRPPIPSGMESAPPKNYLDPGAHVVVVDASSQARSTVISTLREIGFTKATGLSTVQDAVHFLEAEKAGWAICSLAMDAEPHVFHLLRMTLLHPELRGTRVSIFAAEADAAIVAQALSQGAISYHERNFSKTALTDELQKFKALHAQLNGDSCQIAATYIRQLLRKTKDHKKLLGFERSLMAQFPANSGVLLDLARAQALCGEIEPAAATLAQVQVLDPARAGEIDQIRHEHLGGAPLSIGTRGANLLGLRRVVVVDSDTSILGATENLLGQMGAEGVDLYASPEEALKALKEVEDVDLIIHEWRLPKINGPLFIQRVRQMGHERAPIVLLSSLVGTADQSLTREMGVARVIEKPLRNEDFLEGIIWTMKQEVKPTDIKVFERKMLALLQKRRFDDAAKLRKKLAEDFKASPGAAQYFDAEIEYHRGKFEEAKTVAIEGVKLGFNSVRMFNLLGKILMRLRDFEAAIKCFERAQALSPMNVLRLCAMADANCELKREGQAQAVLDAAKGLDAGNEAVAMSETNLALSSGDLQRATKILRQLPNLDDVISYLNNRGIMTARAGHAPEAVSFYLKVLEALPKDDKAKSATVSYNLALAHARGGDLDKALEALKTIRKAADKVLSAKVASLAKRLAEAVKAGTAFTLLGDTPILPKSTEPELEGVVAEGDIEALSALGVGPGDAGCYAIFLTEMDPKLSTTLKKVPAYKPRGAIKRSDSGGLERVFKGG